MKEINSLDELKKIELEIMKKIHNFCELNNIEYFLASGTMLGAVRHKGFIPWDDDIDIFMKRDHYEKFLSLFNLRKDEYNLNMANHLTDVYFGRPFTKIYDKNTYLTEPQYKTDDPIGVFVDIWPLDNLPQNNIMRFLIKKYAFILKKMMLASSMAYKKEYSFFKRAAIAMCSIFNANKIVVRLDSLAKKFNNDKSDYLFCYSGQEAVYANSDFDKKIKIEFEDSLFYIPEKYDSILTAEYGNYMQLPPEEEQKPHHIMNTYYL